VALWHFAHPDPLNTLGERFSFRLWSETRHAHVNGHALTAVEGFSMGRTMPLKENPNIWRVRMSRRAIGTEFEAAYTSRCGQGGFSALRHAGIWLRLFWELFKTTMRSIPVVRASYRGLRLKIFGY